MSEPALLALEDGTVFKGVAVGAKGSCVGEIVFNTSMSGYQEILTDPSYAKQIITFTYPHIGNVGVNPEDVEADKIWASGLVMREQPTAPSNWRSTQSLQDYLSEKNIVAIAEIDTRHLTNILREKGAQRACIMAGDVDADKALQLTKEFAGLEGLDLAKEVTTEQDYQWQKTTWQAHAETDERAMDELPHHVVVYDFGVKQNILRMLVARGCNLTVVPAQTPFSEIQKLNPQGLFLSNGPGDPAACDYAISNIKQALATDIPIFGICLGFQLLALACDAKTVKMKFGHHGANHPVQCLQSKRVFITSQNHGFAVDETSLPDVLVTTHRSLFDGSLQGIQHKEKNAFGFQGHPEASPGPHDLGELFDKFVKMMQ